MIHDSPPAREYSRLVKVAAKIAPWLAYAAITAAMLKWTWLGWADPIVDFGEEVYVAWQILLGTHLGLNTYYIYGPLSPYCNALLFNLFGPSIHLLFLLNFLIAGVIFWLFHCILSTFAKPIAVCAALSIFILLFLCSQYVGIGNQNLIAPYRHGITHGLLCSLAALWMAFRWRQGQRILSAGLVGFFLGLACLTKPEVAIPGLGATAAVFLAHIWEQRQIRRRDWGALLAALAGMALPIFGLFAYFAAQMPWQIAAKAICISWISIFDPANQHNQYYQWVVGTDKLLANLLLTSKVTVFFAIVLSIPILAGKWLKKEFAILLSIGVCILLVWLAFQGPLPWKECFRPLPIVVMGSMMFSVRKIALRQTDSDGDRRVYRLAFETFAFLMLLKVIFNVKIHHYGYLALPATLYAVVLLFDYLPRHVKHNKFGVVVVAATMIGLISYAFCLQNNFHQKKKIFSVGAGSNRIITDVRGRFVESLLSQAKQLIPANSTLAVLPEGAGINYWLELENPTPYTCLLPFNLPLKNENRVLLSYQSAPPDYIALVHRDTADWGYRFFGLDYAENFRLWIQDHYSSLLLVGDSPPFQNDAFSILLLQRRP